MLHILNILTMSTTTLDLEISLDRKVCGADRFNPSLLPGYKARYHPPRYHLITTLWSFEPDVPVDDNGPWMIPGLAEVVVGHDGRGLDASAQVPVHSLHWFPISQLNLRASLCPVTVTTLDLHP